MCHVVIFAVLYLLYTQQPKYRLCTASRTTRHTLQHFKDDDQLTINNHHLSKH